MRRLRLLFWRLVLTTFDYSAFAELYPGRSNTRPNARRYHRFETAAEALRFAMEEMPGALLRGSTLEVNDQRYPAARMSALYNDERYPLQRSDETV